MLEYTLLPQLRCVRGAFYVRCITRILNPHCSVLRARLPASPPLPLKMLVLLKMPISFFELLNAFRGVFSSSWSPFVFLSASSGGHTADLGVIMKFIFQFHIVLSILVEYLHVKD